MGCERNRFSNHDARLPPATLEVVETKTFIYN